MAWEFAMERASGLEEDITIPAGHLRQPRSWSDAYATEEADKLGRSIRETPREDEWRQGALNHGRVWSNT